MTLRHLCIFTAVVDEGGMNKAAKTLHLSQPNISQAIAEAGAALWREIV